MISVSEAATSKKRVDDPYESESNRVAKNFWKVLESESLVDMATFCKGTIDT